jgi:hypothetical protein
MSGVIPKLSSLALRRWPALRQPRVAKRLTDSPLLAVHGADLPTKTDPIERVRKTQDLRQRFLGLFVLLEEDGNSDIANSQIKEGFRGGRGVWR